MKLRDKSVLVVGLGISGLSTIRILNKLAANISIFDSKSREDLKDILDTIKDIDVKEYLGKESMQLDSIDLIIKSPGVPPASWIIREAEKRGIEIISDIELGYRISPTENIISITGSNGKTTTSYLVGQSFKEAGYNTFLVGNIGVGILEKIDDMDKDSIMVVETSSFQLENTNTFKPKVSLILNISPDHLDWHGSYENYINSKKKILVNQDHKDYTILNYDDKIVRDFAKDLTSNIIYFSVNNILDKGIYLEGEDIIINLHEKINLMSYNELKILGKHNLENALASIGIFCAMGLSQDHIREGLRSFRGVEHRLEFVREKNHRKFFNDSKATNPDASIKAVEALEEKIILIAGGYNKDSQYEDFIKSFNNKVKAMILLGDTKEKIKEAALKEGFSNNYIVENMHEAVTLAYELSEEGDSILLSPASASWDMYKNFEERGDDFKKEVGKLGVK